MAEKKISGHTPLPSDVSEPLYPVPNLLDDPLTNPGSWQFVKKSDVSLDLVTDQSDHDITDYNLGGDNSDEKLGGKLYWVSPLTRT